SKTSAIIPSRAFAAACKAAGAAGRRAKRESCGHVAIHLGTATSVLACSDGDSAGVQSAPNIQGKYPNYRAILPKEEPKFRIEVDPRLLGTLLAVARSLADNESPRVTIEFHAPDRPLVLRIEGENDQDFLGLI